jgi:exosortase/archaeosortase family protein
LIAEWLKPFFSPLLDDMTNLIVNILRVLGINATSTLLYQDVPVINFTTSFGTPVRFSFIYECMGVYSALVFSIIIVIVMLEDTSDWKVKLAASVLGILGTFALNIVRVTAVFVTHYFYGTEASATLHYIIGYALFSAWLAIFLFTFSKRKTIQMKIQTLWQKPSPSIVEPKSTQTYEMAHVVLLYKPMQLSFNTRLVPFHIDRHLRAKPLRWTKKERKAPA